MKQYEKLERLEEINNAVMKCTDELMSLLQSGKCTIKDIKRLNDKVTELKNEGDLIVAVLNQVQTAFN